MSKEIAVFWDIDGTLLTTARAGVFALEDALEEVTGTRLELKDLEAGGLTEYAVAQAVFAAAGLDADDELIDRFLRSYERHLPTSLPRRDGRVLPGVREVLDELSTNDRVHSFILTGNTPLGARAKLTHYGLVDYFTEGAYSIDASPRADIARRAAALAPDADVRYVIGDTPHDIECGKAIDARTVAVATGSFSTEQLREHDPWLVLDQIEPSSFVRMLETSA